MFYCYDIIHYSMDISKFAANMTLIIFLAFNSLASN